MLTEGKYYSFNVTLFSHCILDTTVIKSKDNVKHIIYKGLDSVPVTRCI